MLVLVLAGLGLASSFQFEASAAVTKDFLGMVGIGVAAPESAAKPAPGIRYGDSIWPSIFSRFESPQSLATTRTNVALASNGGVATTSSSFNAQYTGKGTIDGDRSGANWGSDTSWNDVTLNDFPDWLQVDFAGAKTISEIDVFTLQDNYLSPVEPTEGMTFSTYGITDFDVQYWNGSAWATVPSGAITGNNKVWTKISFPAIATTKIRVVVNSSLWSYSRITEVEAWGNDQTVASTATVSTDKSDYFPGQIVHISGSGFQPGEPVQLQITYVSTTKARTARANVASGHDPWTVTADVLGNIAADWLVEQDSFQQTLFLSALGMHSGLSASTTFTDNVGYSKAVYNKGTTSPSDATGQWTTKRR